MKDMGVIHLGTVNYKKLVKASWNGKSWSFFDMRRPGSLKNDDSMWAIEKRQAEAHFLSTQAETSLDLLGDQELPYALDPIQNAAAVTMNRHADKGLGKIIKEIPEDELYILE